MKTTEQIKTWLIEQGTASWHQRKAGHFYAGSIIFTGTESEAHTWVERFKQKTPRRSVPCD